MLQRYRIRGYGLLIGIAVLVFLLDQASKAVVMETLAPRGVIVVIPGFFDLVNVRNRGAAFGFLNRSDMEWQFWLFLIATIIAFCAIFALARRGLKQPMLMAGLGLILGGAAGNLLDRLRYRAVIDFLDFYWGAWHWPAFNIADAAICAGVFLACLDAWLAPKEAKSQ